jgi:hypothetical protein
MGVRVVIFKRWGEAQQSVTEKQYQRPSPLKQKIARVCIPLYFFFIYQYQLHVTHRPPPFVTHRPPFIHSLSLLCSTFVSISGDEILLCFQFQVMKL